MPYIRESVVENYLRRVAKKHGWEVRKLQWVGRRGAPDRLLMAEGARLVFVETKAPQGRLEPHQEREHRRLRKLGFRVAVLWSKAEVDRFFS